MRTDQVPELLSLSLFVYVSGRKTAVKSRHPHDNVDFQTRGWRAMRKKQGIHFSISLASSVKIVHRTQIFLYTVR